MINKNFWKGKKVFITGHTGFKGGWLTVLLYNLGAKVSGYALDPCGKKNFFNSTKLNRILTNDFRYNIIDLDRLKYCLNKSQASIVFHLAAQSSVIESFKSPINTIMSNIIGTMNVLEALKFNKKVKSAILITTDKVYKNLEKKISFKENSPLGGDDIYSSSKASCDLIINSYIKSFSYHNCNIASVRAGNCIGGGDWTKDRIVKDCIESFTRNKELLIREPSATRPWQHVLEPLSGYLNLAQKLQFHSGKKYIGPWNFGPSRKDNLKVIELARLIKKRINSKSSIIIRKKVKVFETKNLSIDSSKALKLLKWKSTLSIDQAVDFTVSWYLYNKRKINMLNYTLKQINNYLHINKKK